MWTLWHKKDQCREFLGSEVSEKTTTGERQMENHYSSPMDTTGDAPAQQPPAAAMSNPNSGSGTKATDGRLVITMEGTLAKKVETVIAPEKKEGYGPWNLPKSYARRGTRNKGVMYLGNHCRGYWM